MRPRENIYGGKVFAAVDLFSQINMGMPLKGQI